MTEIHVYRVRQSADHPERHVRKAWYGRTWQAEWTPCPWAARAYTKRGVERKARRISAWPLERQHVRAHRLAWIRSHVTRRRDPFYAAMRGTK